MRIALLSLALALVLAAPAAAAPTLVKVGDFAEPLYVTSPPRDQRIFVVEKAGRIKIAGHGTFLDISSRVRGNEEERGLLSMAFSPDYANNGLFYVDYTAEPDGDVSVVQFKRSANADRADPASARPLLTIPHSAPNHNGGQLQFGRDGMLYMSIGDNASSGNAHDLTVPYGKILRLDPRTGGAAAGNPAHPYSRIWAYGLRNPWRFSFDRSTGDMIIGDVGESSWEEVDWLTGSTPGRDADFGWPDCEGPTGSCPVSPVITEPHGGADAFCAIVGGYVVRDPGVPSLNGRYVYGDNCNGKIHAADARTGANNGPTALGVSSLTSFGQDACGHIYAASLEGPVYRLQDGALSACTFQGGGGPGGADTTAPTVKVSLAGMKTALAKHRLLVRVRCSEACRVAVGARLMKVKRLGTRHRSLAAGKRATVKVKLSKKVAKKLRRRVNRHRFVRVGVTVRATDAAGNTRVVHRHGRVKKRR
jgi:Glucose / Sorbosone dehydrogenase